MDSGLLARQSSARSTYTPKSLAFCTACGHCARLREFEADAKRPETDRALSLVLAIARRQAVHQIARHAVDVVGAEGQSSNLRHAATDGTKPAGRTA